MKIPEFIRRFLNLEPDTKNVPRVIHNSLGVENLPRKWDNKEFEETGRDLQVCGKNSIGDSVRQAQSDAVSLWHAAIRASSEYARALDMREVDIVDMEHLGKYVEVILDDGSVVAIIPKNTCGGPYGDTWRHILQPRYSKDIVGVGGGTTFVAALSAELHEKVINTIKKDGSRLREGHIWP